MRIYWDMFLFNTLSRLSNAQKQIKRMWEDRPTVDEDFELPEEIKYKKSNILEGERQKRDNAINNASIIFAWSNIELTLIQVCKNFAKKDNNKLPQNFTRRNKLKNIKDYLEERKISIPHDLYSSFTELETIRNCVVHAAGHIYFTKDKSIKDIVQTRSWLKLSDAITEDEQVVLIEIEYLIDILRETEEWLENMLTSNGYGPRFPKTK